MIGSRWNKTLFFSFMNCTVLKMFILMIRWYMNVNFGGKNSLTELSVEKMNQINEFIIMNWFHELNGNFSIWLDSLNLFPWLFSVRYNFLMIDSYLMKIHDWNWDHQNSLTEVNLKKINKINELKIMSWYHELKKNFWILLIRSENLQRQFTIRKFTTTDRASHLTFLDEWG